MVVEEILKARSIESQSVPKVALAMANPKSCNLSFKSTWRHSTPLTEDQNLGNVNAVRLRLDVVMYEPGV